MGSPCQSARARRSPPSVRWLQRAPLGVALVALVAAGCTSSKDDSDGDGGSGGADSSGGTSTTSGGADSSGGTSTTSGGKTSGTGGSTNASGGAKSTTGGVTSTTGGVTSTTGGVTSTTGGKASSGGAATAGAPGSGGKASGGASTTTGGKASTGGATQTTGGSASAGAPSSASATYGTAHMGQYNLGPVDFVESEWHNACAPAGGYRSALRTPTGLGSEYLAGVSNDFHAGGAVCDACILVETPTGKSLVARVVTYGVSNAPGDLDLSPNAFTALTTGEYPRTMSWRFAKCPDTGTLQYEFQTEANIYWTSLWVRNPRVPVTKVEVKSANHASFVELRRELDGTLNDDGGFGAGAFTLRITGMDGQVLTDDLPGFSAGQLFVSTKQFQ